MSIELASVQSIIVFCHGQLNTSHLFNFNAAYTSGDTETTVFDVPTYVSSKWKEKNVLQNK